MFFRSKTQNINNKTALQTFCHCIFFKKENTGNSRWQKLSRTRAFSLVELMVVMAIFTIITSVTVFNYGRFSSNLIVTNLAYEAALAVREAQVYGISVKKTVTGSFNSAYGASFSSAPQDFYLFSDVDNDNFFDIGATDLEREDEEHFSMNGSNVISDFCVTSGPTRTCKSGGIMDGLSIIFKRPEPNAKIYSISDETPSSSTFEKAEIIFTSGRGDKRARMTVWNTGQISVDSCPVDPSASNQCPDNL